MVRQSLVKKIAVSVIGASILAVSAYAGEVSVDVYGLSYHLTKKEAYYNAPRGLGTSNGQWVFNPGIGLEYDFRKKGSMGFSPYTTVGYFRDCANFPFYFGGVGIKYRNYFYKSNSMFWSIQLAGAYVSAEDWTTIGGYDKNQAVIDYGRTSMFLPVGGVSIGYQFTNKDYLSYTMTYVPENNSAGGTSGTNILFSWLSFGF